MPPGVRLWSKRSLAAGVRIYGCRDGGFGVDGCLTYPVTKTFFFLDCEFAICTHQTRHVFGSDECLILDVKNVRYDLIVDGDAFYGTIARDEWTLPGVRSNCHHAPLIATGG